jgi:hypothetical protein
LDGEAGPGFGLGLQWRGGEVGGAVRAKHTGHGQAAVEDHAQHGPADHGATVNHDRSNANCPGGLRPGVTFL